MTAILKIVFWFVKMAVVVYVLLCLYLYFFQRSLIYFPSDEPLSYGRVFTLKIGERTINILTNSDHQVNAAQPSESQKPAILYFGGNAENVNFTLKEFADSAPGTDIYMMNYPGFNGSLGKTDEAALVQDGIALYEQLRQNHPHINIVGRSLGSGIAIQVAAHFSQTASNAPQSLILITPFDSLENIAKQKFPFIPVSFLLKDKYLSTNAAPNIRCKSLLLVAASDELVPPANSMTLYQSFKPGVATLQTLENEDHNSISGNQDFYPQIAAFIK